jgi:hypothetical protein
LNCWPLGRAKKCNPAAVFFLGGRGSHYRPGSTARPLGCLFPPSLFVYPFPRTGESLGRTRTHGSGKLMRVLQAGVAEGGAGVDLRVLRGARNRSTIRYEDQERAARRCRTLTGLRRGRGGGALPLTHGTRGVSLVGDGGSSVGGGLGLVGVCRTHSVPARAGGGGGSGTAGLHIHL